MAKVQQCKIENCGEKFENSFLLSQHIAAVHQSKPEIMSLANPNEDDTELPKVIIRTTRRVDLCLGGVRYPTGTVFEVPYHQADDARRILREAYERDGQPRVLAD